MFSRRWFFTHILPILLVSILIGGGVVYAVPGLRQKASQIASKTVGIFADVATPDQSQPADVSLCSYANGKFQNFFGDGPRFIEGQYWNFADYYGSTRDKSAGVLVPIYPVWRTAKDLSAFGNFVASHQSIEYSDPRAPAEGKDTPPFNQTELAADQPVIAAPQALIDSASQSAKIAIALDVKRQAPPASSNLKNSDIKNIESAYPDVNLKIKVTGLPDENIKLLDRKGKELSKDSDGSYIYTTFKPLNTNVNYQATDYPVSDFVNAYRPYPIVFQLISETPGIATITATLEDPSVEDSCNQITTEPLTIPVVSEEAKIDPQEVESEAIAVENQDPHKVGWFNVNLLGRLNEKETMPLANRKVKLTFQKEGDSNPFTTLYSTNEQPTPAVGGGEQTTDANGQVAPFALNTTPGIVKVTLQDLGSGYEKSWPLTIAELPDPKIGFCADYAEETFEYDTNADQDQNQTPTALVPDSLLKKGLSKLKSLFSSSSAQAQQANIDYQQKSGMSCSIEKQIVPGDKDEYKIPFIVTANSNANSLALPLKNLTLYVEIGDIATQEVAPKIYDINGVKLIDHGEFEFDMSEGPNGKLVYKLDTVIAELNPGQPVTKDITLKVPKGVKVEDLPIKATLQTSEGAKITEISKIQKKQQMTQSQSPSFTTHSIPVAKAQDNLAQKPLQKTTTEIIPVVKPLAPKVELMDLQRKNEKGEYVSLPEDRIKIKKDAKGNIISYEGTEIYPGDRLIIREYVQNTNKQAIKKSKLVLVGADDNPKDLEVVPQKMLLLDGTETEGKVTPNNNAFWEIPEMPAGAVLQAEISITLPEKIENEKISLKFTPQFKVVGDKKTQKGQALDLDIWDWLEGIVTGPYGHPVPDAYITLVDKDNKDIEHTYYEDELTSTAKEKLEKDKNTLDFTLTDYDENKKEKQGFYKIKLNRNKDLLENNEFSIAIYLRDDNKYPRAPEIEIHVKPLISQPREFMNNNIQIIKNDYSPWELPSKEKRNHEIYLGEGLKGNISLSDLDETIFSAEIYYNIYLSFRIAKEYLADLKFKPLQISFGNRGTYFSSYNNTIGLDYSHLLSSNYHPAKGPRSANSEWHEFGHYLVYMMHSDPHLESPDIPDSHPWKIAQNLSDSRTDSPGGRVSPRNKAEIDYLLHFTTQVLQSMVYKDYKLDINHFGIVNDYSTDSFNEGFAHFWSVTVEDILADGHGDGNINLANYSKVLQVGNIILPAFNDIYDYKLNGKTSLGRFIGWSSEEHAFAALLWSLRKGSPAYNNLAYSPNISSSFRSTLALKDILQVTRNVLSSEQATVNHMYQALSIYVDRGQLNNLFLSYGFFKDIRGSQDSEGNVAGDWVHQPNEEIGAFAHTQPFTIKLIYLVDQISGLTPEEQEMLNGIDMNIYYSRSWRRFPELTPGSFLRSNFFGRENNLAKGKKLHVSINFDPPFSINNDSYEIPYVDSGEDLFFSMMGGYMHSIATITAEGDPNPLVIDSDDYWQMIDSGMFDYIAEHDFYVDGGKPAGVAGEVQPPTGDANGPASNQQASFNNLPENEKPLAAGEDEAISDQTDEHPASTIEGVLDAVIPDPVFNVVTDVVSTIIDDVNLVIDTFTGQTEPKKDELNINQLVPQLSTCVVTQEHKSTGAQEQNINNQSTCQSDFTTLHQGDKLKVDYSITNTFEQTLSGLNLTLQLNYSKPNLYNLDPKNGFKTDSFDQTTQSLDSARGKTTINWPIDELKPNEVFSKEIELEITEDQDDDLNLTALISKDDLKRLGETKSIPISKIVTSEQATSNKVEEGELAPGTSATESQDQAVSGEQQQVTSESANSQQPTLQVITDSIYNFVIQTIPQATQETYDAVKNYLGNLSPQELWQNFQELFNPDQQPQSRNIFRLSTFDFPLSTASAASAPTLVAGPTISLSNQTPSPVKAPTTLIIDCKGFDKSKKITIYLDNKEYKQSPIISKNFGIKVEIPKNINLGTHTLRVTGENDQQATTKFKINENSWWNKITVAIVLIVVAVVIVLVVAAVLIKRRKNKTASSVLN